MKMSSEGKKNFLIAAPGGANSALAGITGASGPLTLNSGVHTFAATAQMVDGTQSQSSREFTWKNHRW
jgi:hypothetical protein